MNPLNRILDWFDNQQDNELKNDLAGLAGHFILDSSIQLESNSSDRIEKFREYLKGVDLTNKQVVQHTLFLISLINFSIDGRSNEEGWEKSYNMTKNIDEGMKKDGYTSDVFEKFKLTYEVRKNLWINWAAQWFLLLKTDLSYQNIADWYFFKSQKK